MAEALKIFSPYPSISKKLETLNDVGLGYIKLGQPATTLSGGEAQRVKLSTYLSKRATGKTLFILDEPTNDLDMETLDVLEQKLVEFNGTLIIVSHDRQFLDNVITSALVFEADGSIQEYVGGYSDWVRQGKELAEIDNPNEKKHSQLKRKKSSHEQQPKKLAYKEQRKLEQLPSDIERLETIVAELEEQVSAIDFYSQNHAEVDKILKQLAENQEVLDQAIECWAELEQRQQMFRRNFNTPASNSRGDPIDAD